MTIEHGYLSLAEFKQAIGDDATIGDYDAMYERCIETASRQIDDFRGDQFWSPDAPTARLFRPDHHRVLWAGDFAAKAGVVVKVDTLRDGSFATTWAATDWQAEPLAPKSGRPFTRLIASGSKCFPVDPWLALVQVTATWGWPNVPRQAKQACQILALDHFRSRDLTGGFASFGDVGPIRIAAFNPIARALLQELEL